MITVKELREQADRIPTPDLDWDKLEKGAALLPEAQRALARSRERLEHTLELLPTVDMSYEELETTEAELAQRLVETYVLERALMTAKAVIEVTR